MLTTHLDRSYMTGAAAPHRASLASDLGCGRLAGVTNHHPVQFLSKVSSPARCDGPSAGVGVGGHLAKTGMHTWPVMASKASSWDPAPAPGASPHSLGSVGPPGRQAWQQQSTPGPWAHPLCRPLFSTLQAGNQGDAQESPVQASSSVAQEWIRTIKDKSSGGGGPHQAPKLTPSGTPSQL